MKNTYWIKFPRNFANEFEIGVATNAQSRNQYSNEDFERIPRDRALREMRWRGDNATTAYVIVTRDHQQVYDRFEFARSL